MNKITIDELYKALQEAKSIILTVHVHPDGDAIGSMLAMYEALINQGKSVSMVVDDLVPQKYSYLNHYHEIETFESFKGPEKADMLLVLDASTLERIGRVATLSYKVIYNIDHHISNTKYADGLYLRSEFAATGEILTHLFASWLWPISSSMAEALYMAIATDCGFFKFSNTTSHTLEMASLCVEAGARPNIVSEHIEAVSVERIEVTKEAMQTIALYNDNTVATIELNLDLMATVGDDTDGFVDIIRNIEGVDVAILLKAESLQSTRVSLRSKTVDVNAIANQFGGGGHIRAAGCTIPSSIEEAKAKLLKVIG